MTELRPYQRAAIDAMKEYWANGGGNPLVDMATGVGKSVVLAGLIKELREEYPDLRILVLVHVKELVEQDAKAILRLWPQAPIGINSAGLGRRDRRSPILFASVQSVHRIARELGPRDLVLIDEAHLVPFSGDGMYRTLLEELREIVPDLRVGGFTASPYRLDRGRLDDGDDRLFSDTVYRYGIGDGISDGYLAPLISKATLTTLDVSGVARRGGEFVAGALESAVNIDPITQAAVSELVELGHDRRSWLLFASGVNHAIKLRDAVRARGISCEVVTGETPAGERDRIIRDFRAGRIRCLSNAQVLTTGFDSPNVDLIGMLRPTLSKGLYVQICGRGTRPVYLSGFDPNAATAKERIAAIARSSKPNCLVLDYAGNVRRHGPVDAIEIRGSAGGAREGAVTVETVRAKECPDCQTLVALNCRECSTCGHEWVRDDGPKHEPTADGERPILSSAGPAWMPVSDVQLFRHQKPGSPVSLRVEYACGLTVYREWACFEHEGYAKSKAGSWWRRMGGLLPVPATVQEAEDRARELALPAEIQVKPAGKYFEVVGYRFADRSAAA